MNTAKVVYKEVQLHNIVVSAEELQPIRFQGQSFDTETGLHYNRFRYYDPDLGMFISRDPIGLIGGNNTFQYAPNPTGWVDPFGLSTTTYYHAGGDLTGVAIDPNRGRRNLEFNPRGQGGFYVTTIKTQAEEWVTPSKPKITVFEVPDSELAGFRHKTFPSCGGCAWDKFSRSGRRGTLRHNYDMVSGPYVGNPGAARGNNPLKPKGQQTAIFSSEVAAIFDKYKVN